MNVKSMSVANCQSEIGEQALKLSIYMTRFSVLE